MSAQHTQARLEVEDATNEGGRVYLTIKGKRLALGAVFNLQMRGNTLNDARRLAACWNACEGLQTDLLENITLMGDTLASRFKLRDKAERELTAQRDVLLDALKDCLAKGSRWHPCDPVVVKANAAIAKAIG